MASVNETGGVPDMEDVQECATGAERELEKLATYLGQLGAEPQMVQNLGQMAEIVRTIGAGAAKGMKEQQPEPAHTIGSATEAMMADRAAAREQVAPEGA